MYSCDQTFVNKNRQFTRAAYCFIILLLFCLTETTQAQNLKFEHFGTNEGLSQSNVVCILQDSRGFMWIGTREGLNKYDGYTFSVYLKDAKNKNGFTLSFLMTEK